MKLKSIICSVLVVLALITGYELERIDLDSISAAGKGASVKYISPSDNRGAGSYVGNKVGDLPNGAKFKIVVE